MSQAIKFFTLAGFVGLVAACGGGQDDFVVVEPEPISVEPTFTGTYK